MPKKNKKKKRQAAARSANLGGCKGRAANGGDEGKRKGIKEKKQKKINKEKMMMTLYYADRFIIKNVECLMFKV